jgi:PAS domain S-box-containing protein
MKKEKKTRGQLISELEELRQRVAELEAPETRSAKRAEPFAGARGEWERTFDVIPDPISILDRQHRIVWVNKTMANRLGITPEEAVGLTCYECVHEMEKPPSLCPHTKLLADGKEHMMEIHEKRLGGDFIVSVSPLHDAEGRVIASIHVARDITERKLAEDALRESEEQFRQFFENEPTYCYMVSPEGVILNVNNAALKTLGYKKEELVGKPLKMIYAPESLPKMKQVFAKWKETGELKDEELIIIAKEGNRRTVLLGAGVVRLKDGKKLHSVSVQVDITERKLAEEALRKKEAELTEKSRHLEEVNTALKVLLKRRENDKTELGENLLANVRELVLPYLEKLKKTQSESHQMTLVGILESNLGDIVSPFVTKLSSRYLNLTPTEIQVASLIRDGRTTKEIGALLHLSANTIMSHRYHIRGKLGLKNKKVNLRSYLQSLHV